MKSELININKLKNNHGQINGLPANPRIIRDDKYIKLKKSIEDDPEMLGLREVIAYDNGNELVVICGNMRLRACKELGHKEIPTKILKKDTPIQKLKAYTIKDNIGYGEHDWAMLANEWDYKELDDWGLTLPNFDVGHDTNNINENNNSEELNPYTDKIEIPIYEPLNEKPKLEEIIDINKYMQLIKIIESSTCNKDEKEFLKLSATRFIVFNYKKIADYYSHSNHEIQNLMEKLALVIIDYNKALENGFIEITKDIIEINSKNNNQEENIDIDYE